MEKRNAARDTVLTASLNDLLQLDVDAVQAYALAIRQFQSAARKQAVRRYQADHKRHISALKRLIRAYGGAPIALSHVPTGPFKLAMQAMGSLGGDRAVLLAFKSNERQGRDKYRRAADRKGLPSDVARVLKRAAADEERHYRWAEKSLERLGAGRRTAVGRVAGVVEVASSRTVDVVEEAEKPIMTALEATRRSVRAAASRPLRTAAVAAAVAGAGTALVVGSRRMR
ncbi:MAG: ferritin-like domain-containing protein [Gemmatimonadota bacterium]|nr:ferritin-like domain-containing protein [Gemmatimonadota bacterium]